MIELYRDEAIQKLAETEFAGLEESEIIEMLVKGFDGYISWSDEDLEQEYEELFDEVLRITR